MMTQKLPALLLVLCCGSARGFVVPQQASNLLRSDSNPGVPSLLYKGTKLMASTLVDVSNSTSFDMIYSYPDPDLLGFDQETVATIPGTNTPYTKFPAGRGSNGA